MSAIPLKQLETDVIRDSPQSSPHASPELGRMMQSVDLAARRIEINPRPRSAGARDLVSQARDGISDAERRATCAAVSSICVLAILDAIDPGMPTSTLGAAVLGLVSSASAERLAVLFETTPARDAHPIVSALARAGVVDPGTAQRAHLLIDLRGDPG